MERPAFGIWVVEFSQRRKPRSLASHFDSLFSPGGVELFSFFFSQPAKDRSFASVRSFIFFFSVSIQLFLTSIKDLHDNMEKLKEEIEK
jgi:hypothetical protein